MTRILLKNGELVSGEGTRRGDILIEDGKIVAVMERAKEVKADREIDCGGKLILPGLIDAHVHFRDFEESYKEDWDSGSRAAAAGGVTTVLDMPNNKPPIVSVERLEEKRHAVAGRSFVNYGFFFGFDGANVEEAAAARNIAGIKVYLAHSTGNMGVDSGLLHDLFEKTNHKIVVHAEDEEMIEENRKKFLAELKSKDVDPSIHSKIRSPQAAKRAVTFICDFAKYFPGRIHIAHVSCEQEMDVIIKHRDLGVTCEVTPHHLMFSEDDYEMLKNFLKVNPPVRSRSDVFEMWKNLKFGLIDFIATDHAPHTVEEKEQTYEKAPSGVPGVQTVLPIFLNVVNDDGMTISELVRVCCERPAAVYNIAGKGRIAQGYDADLVVVDMDMEKRVAKKELLSKCGWSPYEGLNLKGWPIMTIVNGEVVFEKGKIQGKGAGKEVKFENVLME